MRDATGLFIFLGILGIAALLARQRGNRSSSSQYSHAKPAAGNWELVSRPSATLYENEERWQIIRGPDRLIEEIVIHRKVTQNG